MRTSGVIVFLIGFLLVAGCDGALPTQPNPVPPPSSPIQPPRANGIAFEVTGIVTDERGAPISGAVVTMAHYGGTEQVQVPSVQTDASGNYRIGFTATRLGNGFVARAQVVGDGYEEYWRSLKGGPTFVENFQLYRLTRISAGESTMLSVPSDVGECRGWLSGGCAVVRITIPKGGRLTAEVVSNDATTERPTMELCCESGAEVYGNPVTVPAAPGPEFVLLIELGKVTARSFIVKTTLEPF